MADIEVHLEGMKDYAKEMQAEAERFAKAVDGMLGISAGGSGAGSTTAGGAGQGTATHAVTGHRLQVANSYKDIPGGQRTDHVDNQEVVNGFAELKRFTSAVDNDVAKLRTFVGQMAQGLGPVLSIM